MQTQTKLDVTILFWFGFEQDKKQKLIWDDKTSEMTNLYLFYFFMKVIRLDKLMHQDLHGKSVNVLLVPNWNKLLV